MNILKYLKSEIQTFGKYEKIFFPLIIIFILSISFYMKDDKIALISAICGVSYSILAGKGKFYCYFFGIMSTFCYGYISFKNKRQFYMLICVIFQKANNQPSIDFRYVP